MAIVSLQLQMLEIWHDENWNKNVLFIKIIEQESKFVYFTWNINYLVN